MTSALTEQDEWEISRLVNNLENSARKAGGPKSRACKKTTYDTASPSGIEVDSWRFQDWDFKRRDLPIYARGLFTHKAADGRCEIVARGYDKFFNTDEVHKTQWAKIEQDTRGPYELSVKENGCIIFISGLADGTLLICSKHSTGPRPDLGDRSQSHAIVAEKWIDRQLQQIGRTRRDLAHTLRQRNATAVGELCDDSFEEHILAYDQDRAGIYLHGINLNLPTFTTHRGNDVQAFAQEWGFRKTEFLVKDDIRDVRQFLQAAAETGSWQGKDIEGFVIRCQARDTADRPWHDWFFKYKFEEPYLLYRQWREVTKAMISQKPLRFKKHKEITEEYITYARRQLALNPGLAREFTQNHGIIAMREGFLKSRGMSTSDLAQLAIGGSGGSADDVTNGVVLVPIATLGCGKTTVAIALTHLFGWGHIQNDNIQGQKGRPKRFAAEVLKLLATHPAVFADRNNSQKRERKQIIEDVQPHYGVKLVALHWIHVKEGVPKHVSYGEVRKVTHERVFARGDNHQTIQADSKGRGEIEGIMEGFFNRFEPADQYEEPDDGFDAIIDLNPLKSSRENLETVITELRRLYPKLMPNGATAEDMDEAINAALNDYTPEIKHDLGSKGKQNGKGAEQVKQAKQPKPQPAKASKPPSVEYFSVRLPTAQILSALDATFANQEALTSRFYHQLQQTRRVQAEFHVTLLHRAQSSHATHAAEWARLSALHTSACAPHPAENATSTSLTGPSDPMLGKCQVELECVLWSNRVMCIVARLLNPEWKTANAVAHITIGTADPAIKPVESNTLIQRWLNEGARAETGITELPVPAGKKTLDGVVKAFLRR